MASTTESMPSHITIGKRRIGAGEPVYVVAELSANHHQNFDQAAKVIQAAKDAGADAVKLQTYTADTITIASDRPEFRIGGEPFAEAFRAIVCIEPEQPGRLVLRARAQRQFAVVEIGLAHLTLLFRRVRIIGGG